jgi:hypothetical protein
MCTVTWWRAPEAGGYELFFNRDERRARGPAAPPTRAECAGVPYLAPTDADQGGTWLLVNVHGVTLGLVNYYPDEPAPAEAPPLSRGLLLRELADVASVAAVGERLATSALRRCGGFYLLALGSGTSARRWRWDTRALRDESSFELWPFLSSSSFRGPEIAAHRRACFARECAGPGQLAPADLARFHLRREPDRPAWGILMDRPDARTVSVSHLTVEAGREAVFSYATRPAADGAPPEPPVELRLPLRGRPVPA